MFSKITTAFARLRIVNIYNAETCNSTLSYITPINASDSVRCIYMCDIFQRSTSKDVTKIHMT